MPNKKYFNEDSSEIDPRTGETCQDVHRNRQELQREEDHDQVVGLGDQHHAGYREHHQYVELAALDVHAFQVIVSQGDGDHAAGQVNHVEENGKPVQHDHAAETGLGEAFLPQGETQRNGQAQLGQQGCHGFQFPVGEDVENQERHGPHNQGQDGKNGLKIYLRHCHAPME